MARKKYSSTPEARADHRDRNRRYRIRHEKTVMDKSSAESTGELNQKHFSDQICIICGAWRGIEDLSHSLSHRIDGDCELIKRANDYFEACEVHGLSPDTVRSYAYTLMALFLWIESEWRSFETLDQKKLQDWLYYLKSMGLKLPAKSLHKPKTF